MKKILCLVLALALLLCSAAFADEDNWVESSPILFEGALEDLLFNTRNVTVTGEASFSLDGEWFKTARAVYRQAGENSYWDYRLTAPDADGGERANGYTVVANREYYYVMESDPYPATYRSGSDTARDTLLRETVQTRTMITVLRALANEAYTLLGSDAITVSGAKDQPETLHIQVGENVPDHVNLALSMFWQYAARRFFEVDTDQVDASERIFIHDFRTLSKGLLATTRYLSVKNADLTVVMDASGLLQQISGSASVLLNTMHDGGKQLDITFKLDVTDRDTTKVAPFKAEDYGVELFDPKKYQTWDDETMDRLEAWADHGYFSWMKAGYEKEADKFTSGTYHWVGDVYEMKWENDAGDNSLVTLLTADGELMEMEHLDGFTAQITETPYPDEQLVQDTLEKTLAFLEERYPDVAARLGDMKPSGWREGNGRTDFFFEQYPLPETDGITLVVRALPEWRIESIICDSNG